MSSGKIFLIPNLLGDAEVKKSLPDYNIEVVQQLKIFICENEKPARKFLKLCGVMPPFAGIEFYVVDKDSSLQEITEVLTSIKGREAGLLSDAGYPGIADPGADLIRLAHQNGFEVEALIGPSSILLALVSSGMNGQGFSFHGYLPAKTPERIKRIKEIETEATQTGYTQIFIETPYRNNVLFNDLVKNLKPQTYLSVAANLTLPNQIMKTKTVAGWQNTPINLDDMPCVFSVWVEVNPKKTKRT
ncbi:MAG: SAM-dependent methyltransferase [Bacteroidetes bacterium]|nr:SAM-dependent methyltransferase [Bacteroidota bacterium]